MQYMLVIYSERGAEAGPHEFQRMGKFAGGLAAQGKLTAGSPLKPEIEGARIRVRSGDLHVTDGPFAETKEVIGGFFMLECESREEALEIAKQYPAAESGMVELREVIPMGPPPVSAG